MNKKVCHLTSVHPIEDIRIFHKECVSLAKNGFDVTLIACGDTSYETVKNGVNLISLKIPVKNRIERMIKRTRAIYKKALEIDADIYHIHDPELLIYANKLKTKGKKIIFDSHEDVPSDIFEKKYLPFILRLLLSRFYIIFERHSLKKYDVVISVTPHIVERLSKINNKTYQITNYPLYQDLKKKKEVDKYETPTLLFAGGVSPLWMHENILKAIENIDVRYIIAGKSSDNYLELLSEYKGWGKVTYLGKIPHEHVNELYQKCHVGVALMDYATSAGGKLGTLGNTKLFEIMMSGLPILCTDFVLWKNIVEVNNIGLCVNPHDIDSITTALKNLLFNVEEAKNMGRRGKQIALNGYTWESQEKLLVEIYQSL